MKRQWWMALPMVVACGGEDPLVTLYPATVVVSPETAEFQRFGDSVHLTATVRDQHDEIMDTVRVTWSSADPDVAVVGSDGVAYAQATGKARILATAGSVSDTATITVILVQRDALLAIYEKLDGDNWTDNENWGANTELDAWFGVETDTMGNPVRLVLSDNNLRGTIPAEIALLKHLEDLDLSFNSSVTGTIPPELGELENLNGLFLHHNGLTGSLPPELANLNLDSLDIHRNRLTGSLPEWLGGFRNLDFLKVWDNRFTGPIPESLGDTKLSLIYVYDTWLSGALPRSLMKLKPHSFYWYDTDLCSPPDAEFQDWLNAIPAQRGPGVCDS